MRKLAAIFLTAGILASPFHADAKDPEKNAADKEAAVSAGKLLLKGKIIDDDNISFELSFDVEAKKPGSTTIAKGGLAGISSSITGGGFSLIPWGRTEFSIVPKEGAFILECPGEGKRDVKISFFSRVLKSGASRSTSFALLPAISRTVEITSPRKNIKLAIENALNVTRTDDPNGPGAVFRATLPPKGDFKISWRSQVADLDSALVVSAAPAISHTALPGAISTYAVFNYKVIQGELDEIAVEISKGLNILAVKGEDIQDWKVDETDGKRVLRVKLGRPFDSSYVLRVAAEKILPKFPCSFDIPRLVPKNVLRIDGVLSVNAAPAVKLVVERATGLTQIDPRLSPKLLGARHAAPGRDLYAYKFAGADYSIAASADNVTPTYSAEIAQIATFKDEEMKVLSNVTLDVKDAPIRELTVEYPADLVVNRVSGRMVEGDDYETIPPAKTGAPAKLKIPFRKGAMGRIPFSIEFEKSIRGAEKLPIPTLTIENPKSARGHLLLASDRGISISASNISGMRKIHPSLAPFRVLGLKLAYKFKGQKWKGTVSIAKAPTSITVSAFHLASVGDASIYGSSLVGYRILGAPLDHIDIALLDSCKNPEFTGEGIVDWKTVSSKDGVSVWRVKFKKKLFGDHEMLVTFETPLPRSGEAKYTLGGVWIPGAAAARGFMALSSARNLKTTTLKTSGHVAEIESSELPKEYRDNIHNPVLKAYKFNKTPATADIAIQGYEAAKFIDAVADYAALETKIDPNGEIVTSAEYRLKNTSRQFLSVRLPENAELWTVEVDGERRRVSKSKSAENVYLIPIPRKKDTDSVIAVSISYASKLESPLGASSSIPLEAPALDTETLGSNWRVSIPDKYDFTSFEGDMIPRSAPRLSGLAGLYEMTAAWISAAAARGGVPPMLVILACVALSAYSWGGGRMKIFLTFLALVVGAIAALELASRLSSIPLNAMTPPRVHTAVFAKLFTPAGSAASLTLTASAASTSAYAIAGMAIKLVLAATAFAFAARRRSALLAGVGTTASLWAFSQWIPFNATAAILLPILGFIAIAVVLWAFVFARFRNKRLEAAAGSAAAAISIAAVLGASILHAPAAEAADSDGPPPNVVIESADYDIKASKHEVSAVATFKIKANAPGDILLVKGPAAIVGKLPDISGISIERVGGDCHLKATSKGEYEFQMKLQFPKSEPKPGCLAFHFHIPNCAADKTRVEVDGNYDISSPNAVFLKKNAEGAAEAAFVPGKDALFILSPRERKASDERLRLFADIASIAKFAAGVVEIENRIAFRIAQGQMSAFQIRIPDATNVVSVDAKDLAAWKFNPETHILDVFLAAPKKDRFAAVVETQIPKKGLPYQATVGALEIVGADEQHGTIGVTSDRDVQTRVVSAKALNKINADEPALLKANVKKAFKYFKPPAEALVAASPVTPEIRIKERAAVSFEEERTLIVSDLDVDISKAGLFSLRIDIPKGFDVDKAKGDGIRNWDEINGKDHAVLLVHFDRKRLGRVSIHIEASSEREPAGETDVPGFKIEGAKKHKGLLEVGFERGTRMEIRGKRGVELAAADDFSRSPRAGRRSETKRLFNILRPDWKLLVAFDTAKPWIQADALQTAAIADGAIEQSAAFRYKIENAGVKKFEFKLPEGAENPEFIGRDILATFKNDAGNWVVALKRKEFSSYSLKIDFRLPLDSMKEIVIRPVAAMDVELQKGFLAVSADDAFQIAESARKGDLSPFDPRKIPSEFKTGDLSNSILCFRTVGADYELKLNPREHKAAKLLRAKINAVEMDSVASLEGNIITKARIRVLNIGNENFLRIKLPNASRVWSATIDRDPKTFNPGQSVEVARDGGDILVPLKQKNNAEQVVEVVYSTPKIPEWRQNAQKYIGPAFELPLNDIKWTLHMPEKYEYRSFKGTLDYVRERFIPLPPISVEEYDANAAKQGYAKKRMSRSWLSKAAGAVKLGRFKEANDYFANAKNLALDDQALLEDVQGQWKQAQRSATFNAVKSQIVQQGPENAGENPAFETSNNDAPPQNDARPHSMVDRGNIASIADKLFEQQLAAAGKTGALIFSIPAQGRETTFARALQMDGSKGMWVAFSATPAFSWEKHSDIYSAIVLIIIFGAAFKLLAAANNRIKRKQD